MSILTRKLELEALTRTGDGLGGYDGDWMPLGVHWGAIQAGRGRLETGDGHARTRASYRITIRAVPPTSPSRPIAGQRFREGTRVYLIRAVADAPDARHLLCYVDEEAAS
ncbi:head-tail adaptor protein [Rhodobacteraceae bacterium]|nr:head-tail adaptor protein [Paracoccaceae bacterium]